MARPRDNEYPTKTLHNDIDKVIEKWSKEGFYVTVLSRDRSTRTLTITFSEKK